MDIKVKSFFIFFVLFLFVTIPPNIVNGLTTDKNCLGCLNNTNTQILTIFNFQTDSDPFLGRNSTFIVMPNPFTHTTNSTDYQDLKTWFNFVVTDNDQHDSDPTPGIIEIVGVNNGTYSIMQVKGTPGFGLAQELEASDEIFGTTGFAYVTQSTVNYTETSYTLVEPPQISDSLLTKLKNTGGAKINGIGISSSSDLPSAKIIAMSQILTATPPNNVVFTKSFSSGVSPSTLINTLGIPTYSPPTDTTINSVAVFMPPVFVAPVDNNGGKYILTPVMDTVTPGSKIVIRTDDVDQGTDHPLLNAITLPVNTAGNNIGISTLVSNRIPSGMPSVPSGEFVGMYLDVQTSGDIDFSDPKIFSHKPTINFSLEKVGSTCPSKVSLYLEDDDRWSFLSTEISSTSSSAHTCAYSVEVNHFSSYLVTTGNAIIDHDHDISSHDISSHDSHVSHTHNEMMTHVLIEEHPYEMAIMEIIKQLKIYEIQYSLKTGTARVIVGTTGPENELQVMINGRISGKHMATLSKMNPYSLINTNSLDDLDRFVFEVPIATHETYIRISVDDAKYHLTQTVKVNGLQGKVIPWYAQESESGINLDSNDSDSDSEYLTKFDGNIQILSYRETEFPIKYDMIGSITGLEVDAMNKQVSFLLSDVSGGIAKIEIPRILIDSIENNFVVLVDSEQQKPLEYKILSSTTDSFTMEITLPSKSTALTIIGTSVIPEFGFISSLVLILSLVPILLIGKRLTI
mgnify:FL=1